MSRFWQVTTVVAVAVAAWLGGSTLSWAHGGDSGAVHACTTGEGDPILLSSPNGSCSGRQSALDWAIKGPKGDPGPAGPKGEQGPVGPQGPKGDAKNSGQGPQYRVAKGTGGSKVSKQAGRVYEGVAECPAGYTAVSGGFKTHNVKGMGPIDVLANGPPAPTSDNSWRTWFLEVRVPITTFLPNFTPWALCLKNT